MQLPQFHKAATSSTSMNGSHGAVRDALSAFVDVLYDALDQDSRHIEAVIVGEETIAREDIDSRPEKWTEDSLIVPLIDAVGLHKQTGRPTPRFPTPSWVTVEVPDFELVEQNDGEVRVIGESSHRTRFTRQKATFRNTSASAGGSTMELGQGRVS